jgi:hypothetical protein
VTTRRAFLKIAAPLVFIPRLAWSSFAWIVDLTDYMDAVYGAGDWTQRTVAGNGTDIGPALTAAIAYLRSQNPRQRGMIMIPPGNWELSTNNIDFSGIQVVGAGSQASLIWLNFSSGKGFGFSGGPTSNLSGGGMRGVGVLLESGLGDTNVYGIYLGGNATYQPDQTQFEDLYITGQNSSYFWDGFHVDGTGRTSPQGVRIVTLKDVQIFNCRNVGFYGANLVGWSIENMGTYVPAPGTAGADVYVTGNGSSATNSTEVSISRLNCGGVLHLTNCSSVYVEGQCGGLVNTGTNTFTSNLLT